jgi:hypothetical protein
MKGRASDPSAHQAPLGCIRQNFPRNPTQCGGLERSALDSTFSVGHYASLRLAPRLHIRLSLGLCAIARVLV